MRSEKENICGIKMKVNCKIIEDERGEVIEPRYSVEELEKIRNYLSGAILDPGLKEADTFIAFLKDKKEMEEILNDT